MKKVFLTLILAAVGIVAMAQQPAKVVSNTDNFVQIHFAAPQPSVDVVTLDGETFCQLGMAEFLSSSEVGKPSLPVYNAMIEVPQGATFRVTVLSKQADTLSASALGIKHPVVPAQPSRSKSDTSRVRLNIDRALYSRDAFYGSELVSVEEVGTARDSRIAMVSFSPVYYNPVTGEVVLYKDVTVQVNFDGANHVATRQQKQLHHSNAFSIGVPMLSTLPSSKSVRTSAPIRMLIVSHSSFRGELDEFINWKRRKGYITDVVYTDSIGTTCTAIQEYVLSQYNNATGERPAPTYLLLVGDHQQVPAFPNQDNFSGDPHITDLYYTTWTDGDNIPDCYYGRFSAQTVAQLTPQLEKTLMYEQYTFPDPSFLDKAVLVAGVDQGYSSDNGYTCGDPTMDYVATNYVNGDNGFAQVKYFKNNTSRNPNAANVTVASNSNATTVRNAYNEGAGWINYTAHGNWNEWSIPSFTTNHVANMSNDNKFGFMIGNCCLTGKFDQGSCFGESLLRKSGYKGAVAYIGASDVTYWNADVYWSMGVRSSISANMSTAYNANRLGMYDRLFHTHGEDFSEQYYTAGAMIMAGNMAVQSSTASMKRYYWEVYHLFGDPSISPWLTHADTMEASIPATVLSGATTISATVAPNAYVALTAGDGHELLGAAYADNFGNVTISLAAALTPGVYEFVASAQQYLTEFRTITCIAPDGPYALVCDVQAVGTRNVGDTMRLNMKVVNVGNAAVNNCVLTLVPNDNTLQPIVATQTISSLAVGDTVQLSGVFPMVVRHGAADQSVVRYAIHTTWNGHTDAVVSEKSFSVNAPNVTLSYSLVATSVLAGDSVRLQVNVANTGHVGIDNAVLDIQSSFPLISIANNRLQTSIAAGASVQHVCYLAVDSQMVQGIVVPIYLQAGNYFYTVADSIDLYVGEPYVENFEAGNFYEFGWQLSGNSNWQIVSENPYEGAKCAKSGTISHNGSSVLTLTAEATRADSIIFYYKVSSERNYDELKFYIDGTEMLEASGDVAWTRAAYPVTTGNHTYKFEYAKDGSVSNGSDCVWLDYVSIPGSSGYNYSLLSDTVCRNSEYIFHGNTLSTSVVGQNVYIDTVGVEITQLCLTVVETPQVSITSESTVVNEGESIWLFAHGASRYEWSNGETTDSIYVTPSASTTYSVEGFMGTCSATATISLTVGIDDVEDVANVIVFPNPAKEFVTVQADEIRRVELFNTLGQRMKTVVANGSVLQIPLHGMTTGAYYLRIVTAQSAYLKQIVVK